MRIVILGCGGSAGVPMLGGRDGTGEWGLCDPAESRNRRSRSSIMIEGDDRRRLLVDTGPDLREQLLRCGIGHIDALLYSHAHADHVAGLDEMRSLNRMIDRPIEAFATRPVLDEIARTVLIEGLALRLFDQVHGYSNTLGLRVGSFAYSTDVVRLEQQALDVLQGVDTWIVDCFQRAAHPAHAHLELVREWSKRLGIRRTILTHMGTDMDWAWMVQNLPPGLEAAFDGMQVLV